MSSAFFRGAAALAFACLAGPAVSQSFTENFDDVALLAGNGWVIQNNSSPLGGNAWYQGTPTTSQPDPGPFDAYNGALNAYVAANYNSTTGGSGVISNWLMAPNRTFRNGDVFQFYTRKRAIGPTDTDYPDRLEVRLSTNGASTNVGAPGNNLGDFATSLLSINPNQLVGGYPQAWTQYTITLSGLPAPTSGRIAFRQFATSAGPQGSNSDYIGIDNAVYTAYVCPTLTVTPSTLGNASWGQTYGATLGQTGALGTPVYAMIAGALPPGLTMSSGGSISGTPTATGTYNFTVGVSDNSGCSGSQPYSITVDATVPAAPQNLVATSDGPNNITLSWEQPNDGGSALLGAELICRDGAVVADTIVVSGTLTSISTTTPNFVNGISHTCTVRSINGIGWGPESAPSNAVVPRGNQTIAFDPQSGQTYSPGGTFAIDPPATASSGLEVVYGSSTPDVCTMNATTVSIVAAGTCTLTADQPGDAAWNAAPQVTQSLTIAQAAQVLTFPEQTPARRWFVGGQIFPIEPLATSAAPNSGLPIVYSSLDTAVCEVKGTSVVMMFHGICLLAANQPGDGNYTAAEQVVVQVELDEPTQADLWVEISAGAASAYLGDTVSYSILVGNDGPIGSIDVSVQNQPSPRLDPATMVWECVEAIGTDCPDPDSGTGSLDAVIGWLPPNATVRFELLGSVIPAADPAEDFTAFDNAVRVALPPGSNWTDPDGNNQDSASVLVIPTGVFGDGFESPQ